MKSPRTYSLALLIGIIFPLTALGQWHSMGDVDKLVSHGSDELTLLAGPALVQVQILSPSVVRVRMNPSGAFQSDRSWAIVGSPETPPPVRYQESDSQYVLSTHRFSVALTKRPLRVRVYDSTGTMITQDDPAKGMSWSGNEIRVWKSMSIDEHFYGFGEKAGLLDRTQTACTMWNSDIPAYTADTDPLYQTIPFFLSFRKGRVYGSFMDNTYRSSFDMGKENRSAYSFGAEAGDLNYYIFVDENPKAIITTYTAMLGRMPLPPLWSLGYQQCRWSYATEKRVREIANGFRSRSIPCDVIYLDIDYMDGYRIFTFNKKNFPDPKRMIDDLGKDGFKIAVIVDPGIKVDSAYRAFQTGLAGDHFLRYPDGHLYTGKVWPGVCAFPDFTSDGARRWWGENFKPLVEVGIRGWWNDMNEPSVFDVPTKTIDLNVLHSNQGRKATHAEDHNIYGMQMTRATYDGIRQLLPDERPFVLTRASYAGGWRYSAAWTGDNVSTWEHLNFAASMCLNMGVSGQPFVGSDIGGFIGHPSGELFARWLELGVFTPLMRAHSVINEVNKEPWEYGDSFTAINRKTIELRYRFLPYIYTEMEAASRTGVPAMRPMILEFPKDGEFHGRYDEFMFGDNLLVAPVMVEGDRKKEITIPPGLWFDFWTGSPVQGPKLITVDAGLDRLPLFVRGGAAIPTRQVVQSTSQAPIDPLTFIVFPGASGKNVVSKYYEDDGHSFAFQEGAYLRRTILQVSDSAQTRITLAAVGGRYVPPRRQLKIEVHGIPAPPTGVLVNGKATPQKEKGQPGTSGWEYDSLRKEVSIDLPDSREEIQIAVNHAP
ncbi:MAG: glycoside hydrolase family 31 protein [Bacteroidota bacterium]